MNFYSEMTVLADEGRAVDTIYSNFSNIFHSLL